MKYKVVVNMDYHVYAPEEYWHPDRNEQQCAHDVYHPGHGWRLFQCSRKPKVTVLGYNFCTQHAKMVQADIDKLEED